MKDYCICIPSNREVITTLEHYTPPEDVHTFIISDPNLFGHHNFVYAGENVTVLPGRRGMSAQVQECYRVAFNHDYPFYFRMDDDLAPKTFIHKDGHFPDLAEAMGAARLCIELTGTKLAGFNNSTNRYWMSEGYGRSYGLIHGGVHMCKSSPNPEKYLDVTIHPYEDVYRSLAHREEDGAVGRVKFIGLNKKGSTASSQITKETAEGREACIKKILERFPGMVTCDGIKEINNGQNQIANWRYKRNPKSA
jgi:hypothetical protein